MEIRLVFGDGRMAVKAFQVKKGLYSCMLVQKSTVPFYEMNQQARNVC
ncbi:hypothetical protein H0178_23420 [Cytobacillus firmus]|nr:hypothetical protein [Cytobacillus firmus]